MARRTLLTIISLFLLPGGAPAARQQVSTGVAVPAADGITIDGARLGDAEYDLSRPRGGRFSITGPGLGLSCRALYQKSDLDPAGSSFSAVSLLLEHTSALLAGVDHRLATRFEAGLSYATMRSEALGRDAEDRMWIFQTGAALGMRISPTVMLDLRYRHLWPRSGRMRLEDKPVDVDINAQHFLVGVRAGF